MQIITTITDNNPEVITLSQNTELIAIRSHILLVSGDWYSLLNWQREKQLKLPAKEKLQNKNYSYTNVSF